MLLMSIEQPHSNPYVLACASARCACLDLAVICNGSVFPPQLVYTFTRAKFSFNTVNTVK